MGCDIHIYPEVRRDGKWVATGLWQDTYGFFDLQDNLYSGRNYHLFAILADVRNPWGTTAPDGLKPIALLRGLPDDCSARVRAASDAWGDGAHSHSWLLVSELLAFDWDQPATRRGYITTADYRLMKRLGFRPGLMASLGRYYVEWSEQKADAAIAALEKKFLPEKEIKRELAKHGGAVAHVMQEPYRNMATGFLSETLPKLQALGEPEDTRMIFWFDS